MVSPTAGHHTGIFIFFYCGFTAVVVGDQLHKFEQLPERNDKFAGLVFYLVLYAVAGWIYPVFYPLALIGVVVASSHVFSRAMAGLYLFSVLPTSGTLHLAGCVWIVWIGNLSILSFFKRFFGQLVFRADCLCIAPPYFSD